MNKKYKLTDKKFFPGINKELWQIEALCDFGNVKKGERGGWIEKESNLNNETDGDAKVYGNAKVYGDAKILVLGKLGNSLRFITATWSKDNRVKVRAGCFFGTIDDFQKAVLKKYGEGESDYMLIIHLLRKKEKEWAESYKKGKNNEQEV